MEDPVVEMARRRLGEAQTEQASGKREHAISLLDEGIAALGENYVSGHTIDDSGMALVFSKSEQADGRLDVAIALRRSVLESRISMYEQRHCPPHD